MSDHARYGGKQIGTAWPKEGKTIDTYFQKEHKWVYSGCKFNDRLMYATQQQEKKRAFLTSDFSRRCGPRWLCVTWRLYSRGLGVCSPQCSCSMTPANLNAEMSSPWTFGPTSTGSSSKWRTSMRRRR